MDGEQAGKQLELVIGEIDASASKSTVNGRLYYYAGYALALLSVGASITAGVLALGDVAGLKVVGAVALVPALCATAVGQLRLVEKANWHYDRRHRFRTLSRETRLAQLKHPPLEVLETAYAGLAAAEKELGEAWIRTATFSFSATDRKP